MKKEHPYAEILRAIADGEEMQAVDTLGNWWPATIGSLLGRICAGDEIDLKKYRIKPKTININGHEFAEPMRVAPSINTHYWVASVDMPNMFGVCVWEGSAMDKRHMKLGLCHATKEAAAAHGRALASFTEVKE